VRRVENTALQGWALYEQRTPESVEAARAVLKRALAMDPQSVFALSFLSNTYTTDLLNRWMYLRNATNDEWLRRGEEAADKAYALDGDSLYAIEARATVAQLRGRHDEALALLDRDIALNRNYAPAWHRIAYSRIGLGDFEGGLAAGREMLRLSPRDGRLYSVYTIMSAASLFQQRDEEALEWGRKAVHSRPDCGPAHAYVAAALAHLGRIDEAGKEIAELRRLQPGYTATTLRAEKLSDNPVFLARRERLFDGLRKAGLE
jgi:tetratricopeptide (TPR) repeat protein